MSLQSVRQFFAEHASVIEIIVLNLCTATVSLASSAHNVVPGQIAKTLSLKLIDKIVLIVARGDARLDNKKLKENFGAKESMLSSDEVVTWTGQPVGGVCPFGLENPREGEGEGERRKEKEGRKEEGRKQGRRSKERKNLERRKEKKKKRKGKRRKG
ncbi:YbaK/EbsC family protein, partial [Acinetobacter baumannii]|nr:YbaK/EbsC family protein [Acinetobacter baumannii]